MTRNEFMNKYLQPHYIGDGAYVHFDGYHFILTTQRHDQRDPVWDEIALEPPVFDNLLEYRKQVYEDAKNIEV